MTVPFDEPKTAGWPNSAETFNPDIVLRLLIAVLLGWGVWAGLAYVAQSGQHWFGIVLGLFMGISIWRAKQPLFPSAGWLVNVACVMVLTWVAILGGRFVAECAANYDVYWSTYREVTPEIARLRMAENMMETSEDGDDGPPFPWPSRLRTGGEPLLAKFPAEVEQAVKKSWEEMSPALREYHITHWRESQSSLRLLIERKTMQRAFGMAYQVPGVFWILGGSLLAGLLAVCSLKRRVVSPIGTEA